MTATEISVEMVLFATLHLKAFSYLPYRPSHLDNVSHWLDTLAHTFNFTETWSGYGMGHYLWLRCRGFEPEPHSRQYHFESVMGRERPTFSASAKVDEFNDGPEIRHYMRNTDFGDLGLDPTMSMSMYSLRNASSDGKSPLIHTPLPRVAMQRPSFISPWTACSPPELRS